MKKAGRASLITIAVIAAVLIAGVVLLFMLAGEAPESIATQWLSALARGDVKTLTQLSYIGDFPNSDLEKQWDFATHVANPYYRFKYQVMGSKTLTPDTASVQIEMMQDSNKAGSPPQPYEIPMVKLGSHWKVDLRAINREIYPALPRPQ